ncbi:MAG: citryl-CoA lyase [Anaerolineae bacterium]|nr:citryl-CoA lyase [Anaerolineae bacterium]
MSDRETRWQTAITEIKPNEIRLRGYRIDELMGRITFAQAIYLALTGALPSPEAGRLLDAILVSSIDHGATPPSTLAARTAASTGAPLNGAVAAGVLSINRHHGGAIEDCLGLLRRVIEVADGADGALDQAAAQIVAEARAAGRRLPGFGHRLHTADPRAARLFALADEAGVAGQGVGSARAVAQALAAQSGRALPVNVDGAIAAILLDLGIAPGLANAFFIMARVPGLVAQAYEEQARERPMRAIDPSGAVYDGPPPRALEGA